MENESTAPVTQSAPASPFIPILMLSVAMLLLLIWQCVVAWQTRGNLRTQFEQRKPLVAEAQRVQSNVQKLVNDLLILSETDADAKKVVDKYQIRRNPPAAQ
ncbi:MAG: hypothetical protein AAF649_12160 [Verrucomicrobiota bacterium]